MWSSSSLGTSSPIMSRPLSVNQSDLSAGLQSKPTELRMPRATVSTPLPSAFMRSMRPCRGSGSQMLHGAPTGT